MLEGAFFVKHHLGTAGIYPVFRVVIEKRLLKGYGSCLYFRRNNQATLPVPVTQKRVDNGVRPSDLGGVLVVGAAATWINHGSRCGGSKFSGDAPDVPGGNFGFLSSPFRRILLNMSG